MSPNNQAGYDLVDFGESCSHEEAKDHIIFEGPGDSEIEWDYGFENDKETIKSCQWGTWAQTSKVCN